MRSKLLVWSWGCSFGSVSSIFRQDCKLGVCLRGIGRYRTRLSNKSVSPFLCRIPRARTCFAPPTNNPSFTGGFRDRVPWNGRPIEDAVRRRKDDCLQAFSRCKRPNCRTQPFFSFTSEAVKAITRFRVVVRLSPSQPFSRLSWPCTSYHTHICPHTTGTAKDGNTQSKRFHYAWYRTT